MAVSLHDLSATFLKKRPEIRPGYTVRVHEKIQEGGKERIQVFEGLVIAVHKGLTPTDTTFTVRRIASGVGVEKIFPLHSPNIEKIDVKKVAKVRRAKLFFLRGRRGKAARLNERFTTAEEFAIAADTEEKEEVSEEAIQEAVKAAKEKEAEESASAPEGTTADKKAKEEAKAEKAEGDEQPDVPAEKPESATEPEPGVKQPKEEEAKESSSAKATEDKAEEPKEAKEEAPAEEPPKEEEKPSSAKATEGEKEE